MGLKERLQLYHQIEESRGRPLIVYVTSARAGAAGRMAGDVIPEFIDQIQKLPAGTKELDLFVESPGGDALVSWRVMSLIREKIKKVSIFVPYSAFSAATLLALGCNEIIMGKYGCLGPIDPQIEMRKKDGTTHQFAYQDVVAYLDFVKEEVGLTEQAHTESSFKLLCDHVEPSALGKSRRASSLSVTMAEKLLETHMTGAEGQTKAAAIAKTLNESYFSHGHAVGRTEAKNIGLGVKDIDDILEALIWKVHEDIEESLKTREPFNPISIFLSTPGAEAFTKSPPPLHIPPQVPGQVAMQIIQDHITRQLQANVPDVSVELTHALVESVRHASEFKAKIKILLFRKPDLTFTASTVPLQSGWTKVELPNLDQA